MIYFLFFLAVCSFYFEEEVKKYAFELCKFVEFIHENNPLILEYYDHETESQQKEEKEPEEKEQKVELYENKYLKRFKNFTNKYSFNEKDLEYEKKQFKKLLNDHHSLITSFECKILCHTKNLNSEEELKEELLKKYSNGEMEKINDENYDSEYNEEIYDDYDKLCYLREKISNQRNKLEKMLNELTFLKAKTEEQLTCESKEQSYTNMIENKLNGFMNNYIIECTPVGNVIMRFNNNKKSFEYYSNNSVPYRYLEPIGRKYVLTYNCKDIFIDMDEEVEKVNKLNEIKKNEIKKNEKNKINKSFGKSQILKPQQTFVNKKIEVQPNRSSQSIVNPINDIEIIIKDSNRYTWEGRFANFKIIKSEKKTDNNISFKEFKRRQQNN